LFIDLEKRKKKQSPKRKTESPVSLQMVFVVFETEAHHMYSAMMFSEDSERLRLMRSESKDMVIKRRKR